MNDRNHLLIKTRIIIGLLLIVNLFVFIFGRILLHMGYEIREIPAAVLFVVEMAIIFIVGILGIVVLRRSFPQKVYRVLVCLVVIALVVILLLFFYRQKCNIKKEIEFEGKYIEVIEKNSFSKESWPIGIYIPVNSLIRKKVTVDSGLEELLENRYQMRFSVKRNADESLSIIADDYPQLSLHIYEPYTFQIDMEDQLGRWCFEESLKQPEVQIKYDYRKMSALAADVLYVIVDSSDDLKESANDISVLIQNANADPFFDKHAGALACKIIMDGKETYTSFAFGYSKDDGKNDYYENPLNVYNKLNELFESLG